MLPWSDYLLILIMLLIVGLVGLLQGILVGIIFSIISFIVKYSHTNVIKHMLSGNYFHSYKQYEPNTQHQLNRHGKEIFYFQLQNYLFFGNANSLLKKMHDIIAQYPSIHYVIFDFGRVTGVDLSAIMRFEKIKQFAEKEHIAIYFTNVDKKTKQQFIGSRVFSEEEIKDKFYANYDLALERCENAILQVNQIASRKTISLEDRFGEFNQQQNAILEKLRRYFVRRVVSKNEFIFHENDDLGDLYYIESGQVTVLLENSSLSRQRLRTIGPGNTVGEISLYSKQKRMASAVAEEECVLQILSSQDILKMEAEDPEVAIIFHKFIIHMLAERLAFANQQIEILRH